MKHDDNYNCERHDSAAGWEPVDKYKKQRDDYRKKHPTLGSIDNLLELRPAGEWITRGCRHQVRSPELFGSLWKDGEVAVLFGETSAGKSILAIQIAESIARGTPLSGSPPYEGGVAAFGGRGGSLPKPQTVLYLDFQRTERQFAERYSAPSPIPGKLPVKCRFKFTRAQIKWDGHIPEAFKGDLNKYMSHSIFSAMEDSGARVIIIDDISYLGKNTSSHTACTALMKTLRLWTATYDLSILVLANTPGRVNGPRVNSPHVSKGHSAIPHYATLADSVFAIGRSTFGPDIRYIKNLKSNSSPPGLRRGAEASSWSDGVVLSATDPHSADVLTYQIERVRSPHVSKGSSEALVPHPASSPPARGGVAGGRGGGSPQSEGPFLSLTYLGLSQESDHLRDYAAEARALEEQERKALQKLRTRSSRATLIDGLTDGSYARYLKG